MVILATSLGMVPHIGAEILADSPRWRRMVSNVPTVATQAAQLWFRYADADLGASHGSPTISGFAAPFQTYASMGHLLEHEEWPEDGRPRAVAYLCGPLADEAARQPDEAAAAVRRHMAEFLERRGGDIWPQAVDATGSFRWDVLTGRRAGGGGQARLDAQYWTANVDPSDRYVQSPPGSTIHRLRADEAGYQNLFLAGDWTNCGLNAGCIEAAVLSGLQAANAVRGRPLLAGIAGSWYGLGTAGSAATASGGRRAMNRGDADGRVGPQRPDSFGPFQALTALTDVQRLGLDAATEVVRGFADLLDSQPPGTPTPDAAGDEKPGNGSEPANGHEPDLAQLRVIVARALDLYSDLVRRSFEGYAEPHGPDAAGPRRAARFRPGRALDAPGRRGRPGDRNGMDAQHDGAAGIGRTMPHRPRLPRRADGACLGRRFQPAVLTIEPGASTSATVEVALGSVTPGVYHGHVLARGLPDVGLPVRLLVRAGMAPP